MSRTTWKPKGLSQKKFKHQTSYYHRYESQGIKVNNIKGATKTVYLLSLFIAAAAVNLRVGISGIKNLESISLVFLELNFVNISLVFVCKTILLY